MPLVFQVLGLTATIGVGKSSTLEGAVSHILSVCASLDVLDISKVKQNKEELKSHVEVPTRGRSILSIDECKMYLGSIEFPIIFKLFFFQKPGN